MPIEAQPFRRQPGDKLGDDIRRQLTGCELVLAGLQGQYGVPPPLTPVSRPGAAGPLSGVVPSGLPSILPSVLPEPMPSMPSMPPLRQNVLTTAENAIRTLDLTLDNDIRRRLGECEILIGQLDSTHAGLLDRKLPPVEETLGKLDHKLYDRMHGLMGEVYGSQFEMGMPVPSDEEVMYHQATGQLIVPPTESLPPILPEGTVSPTPGTADGGPLPPGGNPSTPAVPSASQSLAMPPPGWKWELQADGSYLLVRDTGDGGPLIGVPGPVPPPIYVMVSDQTGCCVTTREYGPGDPSPGYHWVGPFDDQTKAAAYCVPRAGGTCSPGGGGHDTTGGGGGQDTVGAGTGPCPSPCPPVDFQALCDCLRAIVESAIAKLPDKVTVKFDDATCLHTAECPPPEKPGCPPGQIPCPLLADGTDPGGCCCPTSETPTKIWAVTARCVGELWQCSYVDVTTKPQLSTDTLIESWQDTEDAAKNRADAINEDQEYARQRFGVCGTIGTGEIPPCPGGKVMFKKPVGAKNVALMVACCGNVPALFILDFGTNPNAVEIPSSSQVWGFYDLVSEANAAYAQVAANPTAIRAKFGDCVDGSWRGTVGGTGNFGWPDWSKINWGDPAICGLLAQIENILGQLDAKTLSQLFNLRDASNTPIVPPWLQQTFKGGLAWVGESIANMLRGALEGTYIALNNVPLLGTCQLGRVGLAILARGLVSAAEKWLGIDLAEYHEQFSQLIHYLCPSEIPSVGELGQLVLTGLIKPETWECLVRANGVYPSWQKELLKIQHWHPDPNQAWILRALNRANGENRYREWQALNGLPEYADVDLWDEANRESPSVGDVIDWMLRDVADQNIDWKSADAEFEDKYKGRLRDYGLAAHVDMDAMKYRWRAHYSLPSPTQLYHMLHRLRPGEVDPKLAVDLDLVKRTLGQNDVHPFWRDRLAAISYSPLTRTDIQRAYFIDAIGETQVLKSFKDRGYAPDEAQILTDFATQLKRQRQSNHRIFKLYRRGGLPRAAAEQLAANAGLKPEIVKAELDWIDVEKEAQANRECVKAIKHNVVNALTNPVEDIADLQALGFSGDETNRMLKEFTCTRNSRHKVVTAAKLCEWYQWGVLSARDHFDALLRLGYSANDAERIVRICDTKLTGEDPGKLDLQDTEPLPVRKRKKPKNPTGDVTNGKSEP